MRHVTRVTAFAARLLLAASGGLGAEFAVAFPGGDGSGVSGC